MFGGRGVRARVILVLRECISLDLPAFDDTSSLGSPPRRVFYPPASMVPLWVTACRFLTGNREAELKPSTFPLLLLFHIFLFPLL